jgi:hypothetical protein
MISIALTRPALPHNLEGEQMDLAPLIQYGPLGLVAIVVITLGLKVIAKGFSINVTVGPQREPARASRQIQRR